MTDNHNTAASQPSDTEREAFETHWQRKYGKTPQTWKQAAYEYAMPEVPAGLSENYYIRTTQDAWDAWQARAAIAVQPPAASQPSDEQIADAVPLTATVLEIEGERLKVCMTKTEVLAFARTVLALAAVQGKK